LIGNESKKQLTPKREICPIKKILTFFGRFLLMIYDISSLFVKNTWLNGMYMELATFRQIEMLLVD